MDDFKLSPFFSFYEMTDSRKHPGLVAQNRIEALPLKSKLSAVAFTIAEPIRHYYGRTIFITSGFRGPALNAAVGGRPTSQHQLAEAIDFVVDGVDDVEVVKWARANLDMWGQLILEQEGSEHWVHGSLGVPYRLIERCREVLRFDGHEYVPIP